MQQDKFERAESCIEQTLMHSTPSSASSLHSTPNCSMILSPNRRKGSAMYWKEKFCQAQDLIRELNEKSIELEEIPGLMVTKKVKPNLEKVSTRVTQIHGSMRAKDVAAIVKGIKEVKEKKAKSKQDAVNKKQELKELFLQCKMKCTCSQRKYLAAGLKECPVCKKCVALCLRKGKLQN